MKAATLLLLRLATGLYLLAWSVLKLQSTDRAIEISDKLYMGVFSTPVIQHGLGALGAVLALFVLLGFLRTFSYLALALTFAVALAALGRAVGMPADPGGGIDMATSLLPHAALFLSAVATSVGKRSDIVSIDSFLAWAERRLAKDETAAMDAEDAPARAVPVEAVPVEGAPVEAPHDEPAPAAEAPAAEAAPVVEAAPAPEAHAAEEHAEATPAEETHGGGSAAEGHDEGGDGEAAQAHPVETPKPEASATLH